MSAVAVKSDARLEAGHPSAWIVIITKRHRETVVKDRLERLEFETYLPMRLVHGAKKGIYPVPFFPNHVFARATMDAHRWQAIFTLPGVARVLCRPERPMGIREDFINKLREREIKGYLHLVPRPQAVADKAFPKGGSVARVETQDELVDLLQGKAIDDQRAALLASFIGDSKFRLTVDLSRKAAGGGAGN